MNLQYLQQKLGRPRIANFGFLTKAGPLAKRQLNVWLGNAGYELIGKSRRHIIAYQPFAKTQRGAAKEGLSVGDYIDKKFQVPGATDRTVEQLVVFKTKIETILEIGPGSGRYLERILKRAQPQRYEIYETDSQWADYLAKTYPVVCQYADGSTLSQTPSDSIDLGHAHKVFTYLPVVVCWQYFGELVRVSRKGGYIAFDVVTEACLPDDVLEQFACQKIYYPTIMPRDYVLQFFARRNCRLTQSFFAPMIPGQSEYLVFVKD
jgi:Methyltransferase domain